MSTRPAATLVRIGGTGKASRRLICVPFAGGGIGAFRAWARRLPVGVELVAAQLPGRESRLREAPLDSIAEIVAGMLPSVAGAADLPLALFGHSMGALIAYELALALEAGAGRAPAHLFLSARRPPDEPDPEAPVHHLPDPQFLDELQSRYGAVPPAVRQEPELLALLLPTLRADIRALESYAPSTRKVRCPLHVYGGLDDRHPRPSQLAGWQRVAEREIRVRLFSGDHFYLTAQPDALIEDIASTWVESAVPMERT
jgi:medium-chain acyl-[acyl-carrier-protein] hydrolase